MPAVNNRLARISALVALLVASLVLVACGDSGGGSAEDQIEATIVTSVTTTDPSKCTELMTANFVDQNSDQSGAAALKECEAEADDPEDDPDEVTVSAIEIDGTEATANVAFVGGGLDGQTVSVDLVEEDGAWKLDQITSFVELDNEALARTLEARFESASSEITPEQLACLGDAFRGASKAEIEELLLSGSSQPLVEFVRVCE